MTQSNKSALEMFDKCWSFEGYGHTEWYRVIRQALSPGVVDLPHLKLAFHAHVQFEDGEPCDIKTPYIQGGWSAIDYLAQNNLICNAPKEKI